MKNKPLFIESSDGILTLWVSPARYHDVCEPASRPKDGYGD